MHRFNFKSAFWASIWATVIMTVFMWVFGTNIMVALGDIMGYQGNMAYVVGGIIHFVVGIVYGLIYALVFEPWMKKLPGFLSGALYSLLPFVVAMLFTGMIVGFMKGLIGKEKEAPMAMIKEEMTYQPSDQYYQGCAPIAPCGPMPCHPAMMSEECPPSQMTCGPKAPEKAGLPLWLWSLFNHLVYGIGLGLFYRPHKVEKVQ